MEKTNILSNGKDTLKKMTHENLITKYRQKAAGVSSEYTKNKITF